MVAIFLLVLANIIFIVYNMIKGRDHLKQYIKESKKKRIEEEEKEKEEEEERKRKKKEKEEEFSSIVFNVIYSCKYRVARWNQQR